MKPKLHDFLMENPGVFPDNPSGARLIQTHISYVFLTGKFAYKIKKPVNLGFLDFTTLEKRKFFCEKELELNKRLSSGLYLEVLPITREGEGFVFSGKGKAVEYCVKMLELPQERIMTRLVKEEKAGRDIIDKLVEILAGFYEHAESSPEIDHYGSAEIISLNTSENFSQTKDFIGRTIEPEQYVFIKSMTEDFVAKNSALLKQRIRDKRIRDCHGDLHTGNIFVADKIFIFDCIEFNERFRYSDVLCDIAYLAMDLEFLGAKDLADYFIGRFSKQSREKDNSELLLFYMAYRAYVKFKVTSFMLDDKGIRASDKTDIAKRAQQYSGLAFNYMVRLNRPEAAVLVMAGLPGTGKSRWGRILSSIFDARLLKTDLIRKGMFAEKWQPDSYSRGIYSKTAKEQVYDNMFRQAENIVKGKNPVILDGTFGTRKAIEMARRIAYGNKALFAVVELVCSDRNLLKNRFDRRAKKDSLSHADWNIYQKQKKVFEQIVENNHIVLDTAESIEHNTHKLLMGLKKLGII